MRPHAVYLKRFLNLAVSLGLSALLAGCSWPPSSTSSTPAPPGTSSASQASTPQTKPELTAPFERALERVSLKPFGLYVSPTHSPVSPERFQGYHTGVDFETFPGEQDSAIQVRAICSGKLLLKKWASGYGGVAVQACTLQGQPITVVYGHLKLTSITALVGTELKAGASLGVLGRGYSTETDGERKHLHLGLHRGVNLNLRGYVQKPADLAQWINVLPYLK